MKILILLLWIFSAYGAAVPSADELLCGPKPRFHLSEVLQQRAAQKIEDSMPPISDQYSASWCFSFSTTDIINYHNFKAQRKLSPHEFYLPENMLSPVDATSIHNNYCNQHYPTDPKKPQQYQILDIQEGGWGINVPLGLQRMNYQARSLEQVPFNSLDEDNPEATALVAQLVAEYELAESDLGCSYHLVAGINCPAPLYEDPEFHQQIKSFRLINNWIFEHADLKTPYQVNNYNETVIQKGTPDLTIAPFTTHQYVGQSIPHLLELIKKTLMEDSSPISLHICSDDLTATTIDLEEEKCGGHGITATGAFYEDGRCQVRLRNSWGSDWEDGGYITVSAEKLAQMLEHYLSPPQRPLVGLWVLPATSDDPKLQLYDDQKIFAGDAIIHNASGSNKSIISGIELNNAGEVTEVWQRPYDKGIFSGPVSDLERGRWEPQKGLLHDQEGQTIYAYDQKLSNGLSYTGSVKDNLDGTWDTDSGLAQNEKGEIVRAYNYPMKRGIVYSGTVKNADDGSIERIKGFDYRDGKMIYAYNQTLPDGTVYTGRVRDTGFGSYMTLDPRH